MTGSEAGKARDPNARFPHSVRPNQILLALGLALTFVAYCGSLQYRFVYDDRPQFVDNAWVHSWHYARHYFTHQAWQHTMVGANGNYYRPLFLLWLRTNHWLFGLRPWGWHLTNLLVHLGVTLAVYFLARRVVEDRLTAALAALIFGLHPVHVEAVVWICGITELLMGLLFVGSFLAYLQARDGTRRASLWLAISGVLFWAAMLTKETAVVFPALVFAYEWILGRPTDEIAGGGSRANRVHHALRCTRGYLVLTGLYLVARASALHGLLHPVQPLPLATSIFTWPSVLFFGLRLLVWPVGLSPFYNQPYVTHPTLSNFALPAAGLIGVGGLLWAWARGRGDTRSLSSPRSPRPRVTFAAAWLWLPLVPLLSLSLIPGDSLVHDRNLYLPSVGLAILAALALRSVHWRGLPERGNLAIQGILTAALAVVFVILATLQSVVWADDLLLYSRGLAVVPNSSNLKTDLANVMAERGQNDAAVRLYEEVLARDPTHRGANYNLGYLDYRLGRLDEAEKNLRRALAVDPGNPGVLVFFGLTELKKGRLDEAEPALQQAVKIDPDAQGVHFALGMVLKLKGKFSAALEEFKRELAVDPGNATVQEQILEVERGASGS
jgi:protein O-mannosyl-transferase